MANERIARELVKMAKELVGINRNLTSAIKEVISSEVKPVKLSVKVDGEWSDDDGWPVFNYFSNPEIRVTVKNDRILLKDFLSKMNRLFPLDSDLQILEQNLAKGIYISGMIKVSVNAGSRKGIVKLDSGDEILVKGKISGKMINFIVEPDEFVIWHRIEEVITEPDTKLWGR